MSAGLDPESVDLLELVRCLKSRVGASVEGLVVGRTRLRDEIASHLGCSALEAELLLDTLVGRGFVREYHAPDGPVGWLLRESQAG